MRVLIVDDDDVAILALERALRRDGHQVVAAHDGREALALLDQSWFPLVITDWMMPEMDGIELCREIRRREFQGYVYVILLTSREGTHNVIEAISAGADEFLTKPFDSVELSVRVRAAERVMSIDTRDLAIFAMAKLAESRDPETGAHLERVRSYAQNLASDFLVHHPSGPYADSDFARLVYLTSPLHDIGKVGIPDSVLLKPGPLTPTEFEVMKQHTLIGARTLNDAAHEFPGVKFLRTARDIALTHHERFDGSGYPFGLKGHRIPLSGRIVALADVYDALTSRRVYKDAGTHDKARKYIVTERGRHFDPAVVDAFIRKEPEFLRIKDSLSQEAPTEFITTDALTAASLTSRLQFATSPRN